MHTSPSGKSYIGITSNYNRRCKEHQKADTHCSIFKRAIDKYGWDNFIHEVLLEGLTLEQANKYEVFYIKEFNSLSPNGYNLVSGGYVNKKSDYLLEITRQNTKDWWDSLSDEQRKEQESKRYKTIMSYTPEERSFFAKKGKLNMTDEQKKETTEKAIKTKELKYFGTNDSETVSELRHKNKLAYSKKYRDKFKKEVSINEQRVMEYENRILQLESKTNLTEGEKDELNKLLKKRYDREYRKTNADRFREYDRERQPERTEKRRIKRQMEKEQ